MAPRLNCDRYVYFDTVYMIKMPQNIGPKFSYRRQHRYVHFGLLMHNTLA